MKYLGIDYGTKRLGVAVSDESGTLAFPRETFKNDSNLVSNLKHIIKSLNIESIVVGESLDNRGLANQINQDIQEFVKVLENEFNLPVFKEKEFFSSFEAHGRLGKKSLNDRKTKIIKGDELDSKAAAIILQRFLDKK